MDFYFKKSFRLLFKTWPFMLLKLGVYLIITIFFFLFAGVFLYIWSKVGGILSLIILVGGLLFLWGFVKLVRRYILYLIKAGHIAVIGELVQKGELPSNEGMIRYGFAKVKEKFVTASVFFAVDAMVEAIVHGISNIIYRITDWIPVDSIRTLFHLLGESFPSF